MRKLIPNDINIFEQLRLRNQFLSMVQKWKQSLLTNSSKKYLELELSWLERDSGVRCYYSDTGRLLGFNLVDEKRYAWFLLQWG